MIKVIKTNQDYEQILSDIEKLIDSNPKPGTPEINRLELLILLVKDYESKLYPIDSPDPISAIQFRMEQQDLTHRDLIPFIGSRSKVSEVLSGKRPLTLSMIRALHTGLGIPIKALIKEKKAISLEKEKIYWEKFPLHEMKKRGWIQCSNDDIQTKAEKIMRDFLNPLGTPQNVMALYKKTNHIRSTRSIDEYSLFVWNSLILIKALSDQIAISFRPGIVDKNFMNEVVKKSPVPNGPTLAIQFLKDNGIPVIIEPHLPGTHLDGAAIMRPEGPIIGLTIRYDRTDNFWFCLMHELAHISLHYNNNIQSFYDDLDTDNSENTLEHEADELSSEILIPHQEWDVSIAKRLRTPDAAKELADKLKIHPAIVAGRMRYFFKSYRILNQLIGHGQVRRLFPHINWR